MHAPFPSRPAPPRAPRPPVIQQLRGNYRDKNQSAISGSTPLTTLASDTCTASCWPSITAAPVPRPPINTLLPGPHSHPSPSLSTPHTHHGLHYLVVIKILRKLSSFPSITCHNYVYPDIFSLTPFPVPSCFPCPSALQQPSLILLTTHPTFPSL
ncbi:hypothetical protein E2C01_019486 [Portunus trituberculatus]|uniref:Uncharacterized protein n=1 Tax=Portunus trituberculatus TaxID=210409 RepID=A0A5B7DXC1_PORTR|nr:hypothetical protein [Portunus trituberculatus]